MKYYFEKIKKFAQEKKIFIPMLEKIVIHTGIANKSNEKTLIKNIFDSIFYISGQKPIFSKLKKSISNFKSRKKNLAGIYTNMRKKKMWEFYHKLICVVLPNIKEFKGYTKQSIDRFGNINIGLKECNVFPDFFFEYKFGLNISIVVNNLKNFFLEFYQSIDFPIK